MKYPKKREENALFPQRFFKKVIDKRGKRMYNI